MIPLAFGLKTTFKSLIMLLDKSCGHKRTFQLDQLPSLISDVYREGQTFLPTPPLTPTSHHGTSLPFGLTTVLLPTSCITSSIVSKSLSSAAFVTPSHDTRVISSIASVPSSVELTTSPLEMSVGPSNLRIVLPSSKSATTPPILTSKVQASSHYVPTVNYSRMTNFPVPLTLQLNWLSESSPVSPTSQLGKVHSFDGQFSHLSHLFSKQLNQNPSLSSNGKKKFDFSRLAESATSQEETETWNEQRGWCMTKKTTRDSLSSLKTTELNKPLQLGLNNYLPCMPTLQPLSPFLVNPRYTLSLHSQTDCLPEVMETTSFYTCRMGYNQTSLRPKKNSSVSTVNEGLQSPTTY
ncbi:uncharacterized protein LOC143223179 [Tachypleus tridentatus]|uniref:uncharacterized protein LOC143223179 n=1 Tax=Tachypleus tridentatus TaxID=6853 RepID=UPI003FCF55B3